MKPPWRVVVLVAAMLGVPSPGIAQAVRPEEPIAWVIETIDVPGLDAWTLSPDGSLVAGFHGKDLHPETWCLHEVATGDQRWCIDAAPGGEALVASPAWLPDGSALLITESPSREPDIWRMDALTGEATDLTDDGYTGRSSDLQASLRTGDPPLHADVHPAVSPDGSSVAFLRLTATGPEERSTSLQVMPIGGGTPVQAVMLDRIPFQKPAWSRDGRWLRWIEEGDDGSMTIGSATPDGQGSRRVPMTAADATDFLPNEIRGTLADGRLLMSVACHGFGECSSWLVDPVTGEADRLVPVVPDDASLRLSAVAASPDGGTVSALLLRDGVATLELIDLDTRVVRSIPLPDLRLTIYARERWLTDGRIVLDPDASDPQRYHVITLPPGWEAPV